MSDFDDDLDDLESDFNLDDEPDPTDLDDDDLSDALGDLTLDDDDADDFDAFSLDDDF